MKVLANEKAIDKNNEVKKAKKPKAEPKKVKKLLNCY